MSRLTHTQPGLLSDPTPHVEYLTLTLHDEIEPAHVADAIAFIANVARSIGQKDTTAGLSVTVGFGAAAWPRLFPDEPMPGELHPFVELADGPRHFPSTGGDIFLMIKSARIDLNFQAVKYLVTRFASVASVTQTVRGFGYLDNRDLIDFVDGTENPTAQDRADAVVIADGPHAGGSYLIVQQYVDRQPAWDALTLAEQEGAIGRTKFDDIEIDDDEKTPYAHNVKSKVTVDGVELKMFRQNRAFGDGLKHGTMFVGFAKSASVIETSLRQMITADKEGHYDRLLDFVEARTGSLFFVPSQEFLSRVAD